MEVFVPMTVKIVASMRKDCSTATIPSTSAPVKSCFQQGHYVAFNRASPYHLAIMMQVTIPSNAASTLAPNAHTEPRSISENFWSETRLWIFCFMKLTKFISYLDTVKTG